jgi:4-amino-4-deoxy-L-arabinose transferase-like glycosyltransferase
VELRHVEHVHLADAVKSPVLAALAVLFVLRLAAGALLPLSTDEAYYWLWSRHLSAGYFDHPPAIAWLIRTGTAVFGQTPFGVRIGGIVLSFGATALIWDSARNLLGSNRAGALASLLFNLTLMATVEMLAATPDAPQVATAAFFFWALSKVAVTGEGRWWIAVGVAAGLGLLSKYSTLFLGTGALVWLIACPPMRRWLASPWPYAGGLVALALFAPNLVWNAQHGWATFGFQFGRIGANHFTLKYLGEFIGAQALLASPFLLVLGLLALSRLRWTDKSQALLGALLWPSLVYFLWHSLHDRVQGNWPCYLYPVLAVLAASLWAKSDWEGWRAGVRRWSLRLAIPVAAVLIAVGYAQALAGIVPMGRKDPLARLLAVGLPAIVADVDALRRSHGAETVITTDYATTAWLAFYSRFPVVSFGEDYRWPNLQPTATPAPALYVVEDRHDRHDALSACFASIQPLATLDRSRGGIAIAHYRVWRLAEPKTPTCGRMP